MTDRSDETRAVHEALGGLFGMTPQAEEPEDDEPEADEKAAARRAYEAKKAARVERYKNRAANAKERSTQAYQASNAAVAHIPFGQPILVGHHSEGRHRRALDRAHNAMGRSVAESKKAEYWEDRAKAAESNRAIFSDDPDAQEKLADRIARLEQRQAMMVAANKLVRKDDREGLLNMGFTESQADALLAPPQYSFLGRGFAKYELSNNGANIRKLKERLQLLEKRAQEETKEVETGAVRIVENVEENRCQVFFPDKPSDAVRAFLKGRGFRWSPSAGAWQRHRSSMATYLAEEAAKLYNAETNPAEMNPAEMNAEA